MGATWHDLARRVYPQATDDECERLLWECSPFPFGSVRQVLRGMRESFSAGGGTVLGAVNHSYAQLDEAMAEINQADLESEGNGIRT